MKNSILLFILFLFFPETGIAETEGRVLRVGNAEVYIPVRYRLLVDRLGYSDTETCIKIRENKFYGVICFKEGKLFFDTDNVYNFSDRDSDGEGKLPHGVLTFAHPGGSILEYVQRRRIGQFDLYGIDSFCYGTTPRNPFQRQHNGMCYYSVVDSPYGVYLEMVIGYTNRRDGDNELTRKKQHEWIHNIIKSIKILKGKPVKLSKKQETDFKPSFDCAKSHTSVEIYAGNTRLRKTDKFEISVPSKWQRGYPIYLEQNCIGFKDPIKKHQVYALSICTPTFNVLDTLYERDFFVYEHVEEYDKKLLKGMGLEDAEIMLRSGYVWVIGKEKCRISSKDNGKCYSVIVFGKKYNVILNTDGTEDNDTELRKIFYSLKLKTNGNSEEVLKEISRILPEYNGQRYSSPSFDCTQANSPIEKSICRDEYLSWLDGALKNYCSYLPECEGKSDPHPNAEHITWLKRRNDCKTDACLQDAYEARIKELCNARGDMDGSEIPPICDHNRPIKKDD
jgi:uncharacterized protein